MVVARTNGQEVVVNVVKNGHRHGPVHRGGVGQAVSVVQVARIDEKQVAAHVAGRLLDAAAKRDKVAPVGAIVLFLEVALEPAVRVGLPAIPLARAVVPCMSLRYAYRVKEIELAPF